MPSETPRIASFLIGDIVSRVNEFIADQAGRMVAVIGPAASACMTAYVLLWGAEVATGRSSEPFGDGLRRILKMCTVVIFALSAGNYNSEIASFLLEAPVAIAFEMSGSPSSGDGEACAARDAAGPMALAEPIDRSLCLGLLIGNKAWDQGRATDGIVAGIGLMILASLIYLAVGLVAAVALAIVFMAYVCLAVLLGLGPLFILGILSERTARFFELWLGQVLNFGILFILVASVMSLSLAMLNSYVNGMLSADWTWAIVNTVKILVVCLTVASVLLQTRVIASALAGGVSLQGQNVAGRMMGAASSGHRGAKAAAAGAQAGARMARDGVKAVSGAAKNAATGLARRVFRDGP